MLGIVRLIVVSIVINKLDEKYDISGKVIDKIDSIIRKDSK